MINDLASGSPPSVLDTEILIIGAGVAGLLLANCLRERGKRVLVLESGGREQSGETHPFNQVVQTGDTYRGASHGRFRCLGGTSSRWGGALLPFLEQDFGGRDYLGIPAWPVAYHDVIRYLPQLESMFGVDSAAYDQEFVHAMGIGNVVPTADPEFVARFAKWPTFARRNLSTLFKERISTDPELKIWINATVAEFQLDTASGRLLSVHAKHTGGNALTVTARQTVVCAGAIESTRLLLLLDAQYEQRVFSGCQALGRYFHDHVSAIAAEIKPTNADRLNRMAGFRFVGSTMRSLRFELSPAAQRAQRVGSAFGHIAFQATREGGFDAIRGLMRAVQQRSGISANLLWRIMRDAPYLVLLAYWRTVRKQLYWPRPATYHLHVVVEQVPAHGNSISLSRETDCFGKPMAAINWRIGESENVTFAEYARIFSKFWKRNKMTSMGELVWRDKMFDGGEDIFHPGGSTRMGNNAREAVLNADLQTFAVPNLWVASTSAFPSGASANPTLMLMLFSMRLADHLAAS